MSGGDLYLPAPDRIARRLELPANWDAGTPVQRPVRAPVAQLESPLPDLRGAAEKLLGPESSLHLQGRIWNRLRESSGDDDNAGIENHIGRAELSSAWQINQAHTLGVTLRHSLRREARGISVTPS